MDVKWTLLPQTGDNSTEGFAHNWNRMSSLYDGGLVKLFNYDQGGRPGAATKSMSYPVPPANDIVVVGGRKGMAEVFKKHGPVEFTCNAKVLLKCYGIHAKAGSLFQKSMTMLVITRKDYRDFKYPLMGELQWKDRDIDPYQCTLKARAIAEWVLRLK